MPASDIHTQVFLPRRVGLASLAQLHLIRSMAQIGTGIPTPPNSIDFRQCDCASGMTFHPWTVVRYVGIYIYHNIINPTLQKVPLCIVRVGDNSDN